MKSVKLISLVIVMLFCLTAFGQNSIRRIVPVKSKAIICDGSFRANLEPLYVIDKMPCGEKEFRKINPKNIESVKVLKDSAATALYGSRGIKGVIIITTKKLSKRELKKLKKKDS